MSSVGHPLVLPQPMFQQGFPIPQQPNYVASNFTSTSPPGSMLPIYHQNRIPLSPKDDPDLKDSLRRKKNSRRKHRNSHLGCGTCKKRRIKCDETLPSCLNCLKGKLHCAYLNLDNNARSALRLAQFNQNMRQEKLETAPPGLAAAPAGMIAMAPPPSSSASVSSSMMMDATRHATQQIQTSQGPMLVTTNSIGQPVIVAAAPSAAQPQFITSGFQPAPQGPPIMQSQYGPLVPVITNTGSMVYAPTATLAPPAPSLQPQQPQQPPQKQQQQQQPQILTPASNYPLTSKTPPPLSQQGMPPPSLVAPKSHTLAPPLSLSQGMASAPVSSLSIPQQPSLTPRTSSAVNAATMASQNINASASSAPGSTLNQAVKLPPIPTSLPIPQINVSKSPTSPSLAPKLSSSIKSPASSASISDSSLNMSITTVPLATMATTRSSSSSPSSTPEKSPLLPSIASITASANHVASSNINVNGNGGLMIPKSGSVTNFGKLTISEVEAGKLPDDGESDAVRLPGIESLRGDDGDVEEKVPISKLIT
ncbi:uncharacterized protein LODBEIA_P49160 [Lodderomyces beijingensis]|uniref:Zn(2)-C6 fungal-type domain-containing protein n=1 Tax=Lodderomyces beijingensis TaxID=1775926 RepID=A0ABP0ZRE1_9ASCO